MADSLFSSMLKELLITGGGEDNDKRHEGGFRTEPWWKNTRTTTDVDEGEMDHPLQMKINISMLRRDPRRGWSLPPFFLEDRLKLNSSWCYNCQFYEETDSCVCINGKTSSSFTTPDSQHVIPNCGDTDPSKGLFFSDPKYAKVKTVGGLHVLFGDMDCSKRSISYGNDPRTGSFVYLNGKSYGGFATPDSQHVLPNCRQRDVGWVEGKTLGSFTTPDGQHNLTDCGDMDPSKNLFFSKYPKTVSFMNVDGKISWGWTTPDSQHVLPNCQDTVAEIEKMLRQAGALRARDLVIQDSDHDAVHHCREGCHKPSHKAVISGQREFLVCVLLLMATLVAKITYQAAFTLPGGTLKEGYYAYNYAANGILQLKKLDSMAYKCSPLLNSTGFVASVAVIISLLHEFPLKPWPQICVSTLFGSYMCLKMATSPREAFALLFLAIPFILLAATGKLHGFARQRSS